ncbi:MAG TPA: extracellular solute-binding protein [Spirochaetia bacterium]|nr:extracellular solute-binding protein [Spirochaetia bacterium]
MKRFIVPLFLAVVLAATLGLSACAPKQAIKLTAWINGSDSFIGPNEQQKPQEQWYISQAFRRFEKANPGVTIELVVQADQNAAHTNFKTAGLAGNAPDVANLWTGQPIFGMKDVILPLDKLVPADDLKKIVGWESVRDGFKADGTILGYPAGQNQICFIMYNKALVKKAGLDWDANPPKTVKDFDADLAKIKSAGITPILVDEAAQSVPWWLVWVADYWWTQQTTNEGILSETYGQKKFADDKGFMDVLNHYHSYYTRGFFRKDLATANDSFTQFLNSKGAMWPAVTSQLADAEKALGADLGVLMPPSWDLSLKLQNSTIGGPGQSLVVAKNTKFPQMAVKLISFLNSKAEVLEAEKINRYPVVRTDITPAEMGWAADSAIAKIQKYSTTYNYWVDNLLTPDVANVFYIKAVLVATGKMTPQAFAAEMDKNAGTK